MRRLCIYILLILTSLSMFAQTSLKQFYTTVVAADSGINLINSPSIYHQLVWRRTGTLSSCTVALDSSADGVTWSAGGVITGQTCTTNGQSSVINSVVNYVRINVTAISGGGTINVTYQGFASSGSGSGITALTGDCTATGPGSAAVTCTKTNGTVLTSAATTAIGTSGATIPLLSTANTWTLSQTFSALLTASAGLALPSGQTVCWNSDVSLSRNSAGVLQVGTSCSAGAAGQLNLANLTVTSVASLGNNAYIRIFNGSTYDVSLYRVGVNLLAIGNGGGSGFGSIELPSLVQSAASSTGGTCTMTTTSCTVTIGHTYTTPVCIATEQGTGAIAGSCGVSGTTVTITAASSNTGTWGALVFGNPN